MCTASFLKTTKKRIHFPFVLRGLDFFEFWTHHIREFFPCIVRRAIIYDDNLIEFWTTQSKMNNISDMRSLVVGGDDAGEFHGKKCSKKITKSNFRYLGDSIRNLVYTSSNFSASDFSISRTSFESRQPHLLQDNKLFRCSSVSLEISRGDK